jgi:hypothetical protein
MLRRTSAACLVSSARVHREASPTFSACGLDDGIVFAVSVCPVISCATPVVRSDLIQNIGGLLLWCLLMDCDVVR